MEFQLTANECRNLETSSEKEWLLANGIGGYAMGSASGINSRRYHGHLVAAIDPPTERMVLLAAVEAVIEVSGTTYEISTNRYSGAVHPEGYRRQNGFHAGEEAVWTWEIPSGLIEKRLRLHSGSNGCTVEFANLGTERLTLRLRPLVCHKPHHQNFRWYEGYPERTELADGVTTVWHEGIGIVLRHPEAKRETVADWYYNFWHERESERGLDPTDDLYSPIELTYEVFPGERIRFACGDSADVVIQSAPKSSGEVGRLKEALISATGKFVVETERRTSLLAGYPWFSDWGRDTMISLPGILLCTGHIETARRVLRDYAAEVRDGLIPNVFSEVGGGAHYNTADATLWFVNAVYLTLQSGWDEAFAREMAPVLMTIFEHHLAGTRYGIGVDPTDGLLRQGEPGAQLTWMDAKIGDWVVTPRHGKAVEINALWINALHCMAWIRGRLDLGAEVESLAASQAAEAFESKFWCEELGYFLDTVDPIELSLRPNQLIALSLSFPAARGDRARRALGEVEKHLLTPKGLRTLDPRHPSYQGRFEGSMADRDAAYHQGTVWPWLLGPYASATMRVDGDSVRAKAALEGMVAMLADVGLGGISEVYDGDAPHRGGGCPWQAWSVAEALRAWTEVLEVDSTLG
jgi:predicted glycogen debranching enzyme